MVRRSGLSTFVNADLIAQGLSGLDPEGAAFEAGRVMLERLDELAGRRVSFAFETTLAGRAYARRISELLADGVPVPRRVPAARQPGAGGRAGKVPGARRRSRDPGGRGAAPVPFRDPELFPSLPAADDQVAGL